MLLLRTYVRTHVPEWSMLERTTLPKLQWQLPRDLRSSRLLSYQRLQSLDIHLLWRDKYRGGRRVEVVFSLIDFLKEDCWREKRGRRGEGDYVNFFSFFFRSFFFSCAFFCRWDILPEGFFKFEFFFFFLMVRDAFSWWGSLPILLIYGEEGFSGDGHIVVFEKLNKNLKF